MRRVASAIRREHARFVAASFANLVLAWLRGPSSFPPAIRKPCSRNRFRRRCRALQMAVQATVAMLDGKAVAVLRSLFKGLKNSVSRGLSNSMDRELISFGRFRLDVGLREFAARRRTGSVAGARAGHPVRP